MLVWTPKIQKQKKTWCHFGARFLVSVWVKNGPTWFVERRREGEREKGREGEGVQGRRRERERERKGEGEREGTERTRTRKTERTSMRRERNKRERETRKETEMETTTHTNGEQQTDQQTRRIKETETPKVASFAKGPPPCEHVRTSDFSIHRTNADVRFNRYSPRASSWLPLHVSVRSQSNNHSAHAPNHTPNPRVRLHPSP